MFSVNSLLFVSFLLVYGCVGQPRLDRQASVGYRYVLDNECSPTLYGQRIAVPPEQQQLFFDFIAVNISDIRMYPADCRRPALWLLCSLVFPAVVDETDDACVVGIEECEFTSEQCFGLLDCGLFENFFSQEGRGDVCPRLLRAGETPVAVETCINADRKELKCCFEPYIRADDSTEECVVGCPAGFWDPEDSKIVAYVVFGMMWVGFIMAFIGFVPLCFFKRALDFPKQLVPLGVIFVLWWTLFKMWGVFVGIDYYVCQGNEDGVAALVEFLDSDTCMAQLFFMNWLPACVSLQMVAVACVFTGMVHNPDPKFIQKMRPYWYVVVIVLPLVVCVIVQLLYELGDYDSSLLLPGIANSCQMDVSSSIGIILNVFYSTCFFLTYIIGFIGLVKIFRRSWQLARIHFRLVVFLFFMTVVSSLLLVLFYRILPENIDYADDYQDGIACVAFHPQDPDYPCQTIYDDNFAYFVVVEVSIILAVLIMTAVLFMNRMIFAWWYNLVVHQEVGTSATSSFKSVSGSSGSMDDVGAPRRSESHLSRMRVSRERSGLP
mmetsp:Transcript_20782/g.32442  ORF Transcript_20782/g.32442 Transcript_20782/m.32442 type:complete len:549 (-) Transcript_20782:107-1753(-)